LLASTWGKSVRTMLPDGRTRISSKKQHPVCVWDLTTGKMHFCQILANGGAGPVAFSPDNKLFAASAGEPESRIRICDLATNKEISSVKGFNGLVRSMAFSANSEKLFTGMEDGTVLVWDWKVLKR